MISRYILNALKNYIYETAQLLKVLATKCDSPNLILETTHCKEVIYSH